MADADGWDEGSVLLAVFESDASARRAADVVARKTGDPDRVRVGRPTDGVAAVKAEMQEEMDESWTSPHAGVAYPKEAAKGLVLLLPPCCLIGGLVVAPLGFIPVDDVALWVRLLVAAAVGVLMGGTVALVAGPALAANRPDDQLAAEQGVVVRVDGARPDVLEALVAARPLRVDRVRASDLVRLETITTRDESDLPTIASHVLDRSIDPTGDADMQSGRSTNRTVESTEGDG